jgi:hypothetical protein
MGCISEGVWLRDKATHGATNTNFTFSPGRPTVQEEWVDSQRVSSPCPSSQSHSGNGAKPVRLPRHFGSASLQSHDNIAGALDLASAPHLDCGMWATS